MLLTSNSVSYENESSEKRKRKTDELLYGTLWVMDSKYTGTVVFLGSTLSCLIPRPMLTTWVGKP